MTDLGVAVPAHHHVGVVENDVAAHRLGESLDPFGCGALPRRQPVMVPELRRGLRRAMHGQAKMAASRTCFPTRIQGRLRPRAMLTRLYPRTPWRNREPDGAFRHRG